jgi:hypothetical protein
MTHNEQLDLTPSTVHGARSRAGRPKPYGTQGSGRESLGSTAEGTKVPSASSVARRRGRSSPFASEAPFEVTG